MNNSLFLIGYVIDKNGKLYLQNCCVQPYTLGSWSSYCYDLSGARLTTGYEAALPTTIRNDSYNDKTYVKVGITLDSAAFDICVYATDTSHSQAIKLTHKYSNSGDEGKERKLLNILDGGEVFQGTKDDLKSTGILWFSGTQVENATTPNKILTEKTKEMFESHSASRTVTKSALLSKRLAKFSSLAEDDILTVSDAGWFVNNTTDLDTFLGTQSIAMAGDTADIDAVAEIEPLHFNVVVPTTLPIYVATDGTVTVATNATIENKSNAAVRITDLNIDAKPESGWTLVADNPSDIRDAKQFTFETSLAVNMVLDRGEVKPFTYATKLSPMTTGSDSLDLATVSVTVDWAD